MSGAGSVINVKGDGIDVDASEDCYFSGLTLADNEGSGFHFGSPRPIVGSKDNIVRNMRAYRNGFGYKRNGFDLSWPNRNGAVFQSCVSVNNYRNWQIEAAGAVLSSFSIDDGLVEAPDDFGGAYYSSINGEDLTSPSLLSKKTKVLLYNDLKKLFGLGASHLNGVEYD